MLDALPSIAENLARLKMSSSQIVANPIFATAIGFCGDVRRVFFTVHGRLLFENETISPGDFKAFTTSVNEALPHLATIATNDHGHAGRVAGYERSIRFRLECMTILMADGGEQKAFEKLIAGTYFGEFRSVATTVEEKLLRQLAHLQWELDHEKGPFVDACKVFNEIVRPYETMLDRVAAPSTLTETIRKVFHQIRQYFESGEAPTSPDKEKVALKCIRRAAQLIYQVVSTELEADPERPKRQHDDHLAVLANGDWLKKYEGQTVAVGAINGERVILGAGLNLDDALEKVKTALQNDSRLSRTPVTFVKVPIGVRPLS